MHGAPIWLKLVMGVAVGVAWVAQAIIDVGFWLYDSTHR